MTKPKAGRKRIAGIKRTASGRRSRAAAAYQENADPILIRMRMFGLTEADARDQKAATFIGRLSLAKTISQPQYDAAQQFLAIHGAYMQALKAPDALRNGTPSPSRDDDPEYERRCRRAMARYDAAIEAIRVDQNLHQNRGANLYAALDYVVVRDEVMWHLVGDARLALNALAHHFGIVRKVFTAAAPS